MRYADPALCPDCRSVLPPAATTCPTCGLVVRHVLAVELFRTLAHADDVLTRLRAVSTAPMPVAAPLPMPVGPPPLSPEPRGLGLGWVPKILLGLGALCLLVAAITFLAVTWSHLGVGGRTAVLLAFTAAAGATALLLHRFELRVAGESLIVVALGLLGLDVVGAGTAGWFGDLSDGTIAAAAGCALLVAGVATGLLRIADRPRLVAPQVVAGLGLALADVGSLAATSHDLVAGHVWVVLGGAAVLLGRRTGLPVLAWSTFCAAGIAWTIGGLLGLALSLEEPELHQLWVAGSGWSLVASAAALVVPGLVLRQRALLQAGCSAAALVLTVTLTLPVVDGPVRTLGVVALLVTLAWALGLAFLPRVLRPVAAAPAVVGALVLVALVLTTAAAGVDRWGRAVSHASDGVGDRFRGAAPVTEPLLTVPSALVVLGVLALLVPAGASGRRPWSTWTLVGGLVAGVGAAVTLAAYDVPVLLAMAVLALSAVGATAATVVLDGGRQVGFGLASLLVAGAAVLAGIAWPALATIALAVALGVTATLHLLPRDAGLRVVAGAFLPVSLAGLLEAASALGDVDPAWRGMPVLVAVGLLAIARPRTEIEMPAVVSGVLCAVPAIGPAHDQAGSLALHLTVAGCLVAATALVNDSRRHLAWAGAALLVVASWVRLADLGVSAPEPYTLPLAGALVAVGLWRLRESPAASTAVTLTPGLVLATVPSLVWVLDDPTSLRAALLGLGAVALAVVGSVLRWSAPLVVGSAVGAAVVLRELGPYAGDAPAWVWMAIGGALLVVVGVTWERRLLEVRKAVGLLGRLR